MFQVPWFLVELEGDHPKSHQIVNRCDVTEITESNCKVNFKRDQERFSGYIISASEYRSYVEQIMEEERAKSKQLGLTSSTDAKTKHSKTSKWFVIQYQKTREQGVVHEVVCKNDLVWTIANGLKTATGLGEDVFTRDGDVLRLANIVYIANNYDTACDKMHEIKGRLDEMFFKKARQNGEWFLLQYSTNRSRIMYGIFNRSIMLYQKENKNSDFAYIPHPQEEAIIQGAVIQRSAYIDKLYECLQHIRNACFNIEFIQNSSNPNRQQPCLMKTTIAKKDNCIKKNMTTNVDADVLTKIMCLEKVMFKESKHILTALHEIDATTKALEMEIEHLEKETDQHDSEMRKPNNQKVEDEDRIDCLPALREFYATRVDFFLEDNNKNAPLRLESHNKRLNRISENQTLDYDVLTKLNKIVCDIKTDIASTTDEKETTSANHQPSFARGLSLSDEQHKRKRKIRILPDNKKYPMLVQGDPALVILGFYGTTVEASDFDNIPWSMPTTATRTLLALVFGNEILSTHTLSGKPSPAFHGRERPQKCQLDPLKTADIVHCIRAQCGINERAVRASITTKCADTAKRLKRRKKDK